MVIDPAVVAPADLHRFLIATVVPRPIAFVSTVGAQGRFNVAPFSFFNVITSRPPLLGISIGRRRGEIKDTLRNILETRDFVINAVDEPLLARAVQASGDWPPEVDEFQLTSLTPAASDRVKSPRVDESPASLECVLERVVEFERTSLVVGEMLVAHVKDEVLTDGEVDPLKLQPVGRLGADGYSVVRDVLRLARPKVQGPAS
jgi:flavin reductase (DIM6/NTAB) family NADH-FMN oxidoreductase RutF